MSCTDCNKVKEMLHTVIDGEVNSDDLKSFNEHLDKCIGCKDHYHEEKILLQEIKNKIDSKCCPKNVLDSIRDKIKLLSK